MTTFREREIQSQREKINFPQTPAISEFRVAFILTYPIKGTPAFETCHIDQLAHHFQSNL